MTTTHTQKIECPICGETVSTNIIMSTNYMGPTDYDIRPEFVNH